MPVDFTVNGEPKKELKSLGDGGVEVVGMGWLVWLQASDGMVCVFVLTV